MSATDNAVRRYERALLHVWEAAPAEARAFGPEWYPSARREAEALAVRYGFSVEQVTGVIAALSPRVKWSANLADAAIVLSWCEDARDGLCVADVWTLRADCNAFTANIILATECASVEDPLTVLNGPKQRAFYRNIIGDAAGVTVDVWATRAATRGALDGPRSRTEYALIERAYVRAARKVGETPRDFQAAVWLAIRDTSRRVHDETGARSWQTTIFA